MSFFTTFVRRFSSSKRNNVPEQEEITKPKKSNKVKSVIKGSRSVSSSSSTTTSFSQSNIDRISSSDHNNNSSTTTIAGENAVTELLEVIPSSSYVYHYQNKNYSLSVAEQQFNCQSRICASEVKYSMVVTVTNSWELDLKTIPNWDKIGGELLLRKMFELEPDCIRMFGFPLDTKYDDPNLSHDEKFIKKGVALIVAVDIALSMLGPDLEPLEDQLVQLGKRHVARQCKPRHWPMVGVALFYTLEQALGDKFTKKIQDCWVILYNFLGYHMIRGLIQNGGPTWEDN